MCKHIAAVLYGVGARLDESPELSAASDRSDGTVPAFLRANNLVRGSGANLVILAAKRMEV